MFSVKVEKKVSPMLVTFQQETFFFISKRWTSLNLIFRKQPTTQK